MGVQRVLAGQWGINQKLKRKYRMLSIRWKWKLLTCSNEDEGSVGPKHCCVGELEHCRPEKHGWSTASSYYCISNSDSVTQSKWMHCTLNRWHIIKHTSSHLQRGRSPTASPVWTSAALSHGGSELKERRQHKRLRNAATLMNCESNVGIYISNVAAAFKIVSLRLSLGFKTKCKNKIKDTKFKNRTISALLNNSVLLRCSLIPDGFIV